MTSLPADTAAPTNATCQLLLTRRQSVLPISIRSDYQQHQQPGHASSSSRQQLVTSKLSAIPHVNSACGSENNPWVVVAWRPGQRINISTIDLSFSPHVASPISPTSLPVSAAADHSGVSMATVSTCRRYVRMRERRPPATTSDEGDEVSVDGDEAWHRRDGCLDEVVRSGTMTSHGEATGNRKTSLPSRESTTFTSTGGNVEVVVDRFLAPDNFLLIFTCESSVFYY
jgi:hypothetical protein